MTVRRRQRLVLAIGLLLAAAAGATTPASAAPLDERVPGGALLYVGWQGTDAAAPAYAGSNLKGFLEASALPALAVEIPDLLQQRSADPEMAAQLQFAASVLGPLWRHPTALFVTAAGDQPGPPYRIGLLCEAGPDAAPLARALRQFAAALADTSLKPTVAQDTGCVAIGFGFPARDLLRIPAPSLATNPDFARAVRSPLPGITATAPALLAYADMHAFLASLDAFLAQRGLAGAQPAFHAVYDATGLSSISQAGFAAGFAGKSWVQWANLGITGPRRGIVRLIAPEPFDAAALRMIPNDAVDLAVRSINLQALFADLEAALPAIDPSFPAAFAQQLSALRDDTGVDVQKDLVNTVGNVLVLYRAPQDGGDAMPPVLLVALKNPRAAGDLLRRMEAKWPPSAGGIVAFDTVHLPGGMVHVIRVGSARWAYAIAQDQLVLTEESSMPAVLRQVGAQSRATPTGTITGNPAFATARAEFPSDLFTLTYTDSRRQYPELAGWLNDAARAAASATHLALPQPLLPPVQALQTFLPPMISAGWTDSQGAHWVERCGFPGAPLLKTGALLVGGALQDRYLHTAPQRK